VCEYDVEDCELCESPGGEVVWESDLCRVVMVGDPDYWLVTRITPASAASFCTGTCVR